MRILVVTDAWLPQVNGVVRTMERVIAEAREMGHAMEVLAPHQFRSLPCPGYAEIRLALAPRGRLARMADAFAPQAVHIATEGPLGFAARGWARARGMPFTSAFHTRFPEYVRARTGLPLGVSYRVLRRFHDRAAGVMVATASMRRELERRGFRRLRPWSRGVDTNLFRPRDKGFLDLPRPIFLHVGRLAVEKNVEAFLDLDLPGSKLVVGGGPLLETLRRRHRNVRFTGPKLGEDLARHYAAADVFVFPSRTDTFGLVMLEALASGLPVAAYPVPGPLDVVGDAPVGRLDDDLRRAALAALDADPALCRAHALGFSWRRCAEEFLANLESFA
jgi:glycosyltransferase involved in cell wall biosynthesis